MGTTAIDRLEELLQEQWRLINQLRRQGVRENRALFVSNQAMRDVVDGLKAKAAERGITTPSTDGDLVQFPSLVKS